MRHALTRRLVFTLKFLVPFLILAIAVLAAAFALDIGLEKIWPLFPGAAGFAGIFAGIRKRNRFAADFVIPSLAFILLSGFFLLFSLDVIAMRFLDFIQRFWLPLAAACVGLAYLALFFYKKGGTKFPRAH